MVSVYFPPSRSLAEFESYFDKLESLIRQFNLYPVLAAGDLNAKFAAWGSSVIDAHGGLLEEWLLEVGLSAHIRGSVHKCVRSQGGSIVDVLFASPALACRVRAWKVIVGVETLSDHQHIYFEVVILPDALTGPNWPTQV